MHLDAAYRLVVSTQLKILYVQVKLFNIWFILSCKVPTKKIHMDEPKTSFPLVSQVAYPRWPGRRGVSELGDGKTVWSNDGHVFGRDCHVCILGDGSK